MMTALPMDTTGIKSFYNGNQVKQQQHLTIIPLRCGKVNFWGAGPKTDAPFMLYVYIGRVWM